MYLSQSPLTAVGVVTATAVTRKLTIRGLLFACHIFVTMGSAASMRASRSRDSGLRRG